MPWWINVVLVYHLDLFWGGVMGRWVGGGRKWGYYRWGREELVIWPIFSEKNHHRGQMMMSHSCLLHFGGGGVIVGGGHGCVTNFLNTCLTRKSWKQGRLGMGGSPLCLSVPPLYDCKGMMHLMAIFCYLLGRVCLGWGRRRWRRRWGRRVRVRGPAGDQRQGEGDTRQKNTKPRVEQKTFKMKYINIHKMEILILFLKVKKLGHVVWIKRPGETLGAKT